MPEPNHGKILLRLAREAIDAQFGLALPAAPEDLWLREPGATFVTLTQNGKLRGCIGSLVAYRALRDDVRANAVAAAFRDPRFEPLQAAEWPRTALEVSLLSPQQPLSFGSEEDALAQLKPGIDGVVFEYRQHHSTFLPQVWKQLPTPSLFLGELKRKAGMPADFWADEVKLARYRVEKFI